MQQPQLKSKILLSKVESLLLRDNAEVDEFTLARLSREADKLITIDPVRAYVALGIVATLKTDIEEVHYNFKLAIESSENDTLVWNNYAVCLGFIGYNIEAANIFKYLVTQKNATHNLKTLSIWIRACCQAGLFFTGFEFLKKYNEKSQQKPHSLTENTKHIVLFMEELKITEDMLIPIFAAHFQILRKYNVTERFMPAEKVNQVNYYYYDKQYNEFRYEIYIDKSADEVCEMADELAEAVAELDLPADVVYHFTPLYRVYSG